MSSTTFFDVVRTEEVLLELIHQLDVQSIFRLGRTCKEFQRIPRLAWDGNSIWGQFVDDKVKLRNVFDRTGATATGGALVSFLGRDAPSKWPTLKILINHYNHAKEMEQFFITEGYNAVEVDGPIDSKCYPMACKLSKQRRNSERSVMIMTCHGSSELQAVLMANNTTEAVTLTSKRVVCMFPLLGLMHRCAYPFDGKPDRKRTNGYDFIASHVLPGQHPLAKATRTELGRKRLLGDEQCFIIPLCADPGGKSEWSMEIRPKGGVTLSFDGGIVTWPWQSVKSTMAMLLAGRNGGAASPSRLVGLVERGDMDATMQLIQNGANMDEEDIYGRSVLSRAVELLQTDIASLLIEQGANVDAEDNCSRPVLSRVEKLGQTDITKQLIEHGAVHSAAQDRRDQPCQTPTLSGGDRMVFKNITVSGMHIDVHATDTGRHIQYYKESP